MARKLPPNAKRIEIGGETAFLWETASSGPKPEWTLTMTGWSVLQGPYQIDLENVERKEETWHTIDWTVHVPRCEFGFEGGLARREAGYMDRETFLVHAEKIMAALRRDNAPPSPPAKRSQDSKL